MSTKGGTFVRHIACTNPECNSSDALAVYQQEDGTQDATCFSCGHYERSPSLDGVVRDPSPHRGSEPATVASVLSVAQLLECPMRGIPSRQISQQTAEFFGVRTILNGYDGQTPVAIGFPYYNTNTIIGYKKRLLEQKIFTVIGTTKDCLLFGQQLFLDGGKRLYITEGEIDCLSLFQTLRELAGIDYKHLIPCVVSLPHGATSAATALGRARDFLDLFSEIVLVFDQDEAGQQAVDSVCSFLDPSKVKVAKFSEKDANAMVMANKASDLRWSVLSHAKPHQPEGITTSQKLLTEALKPSERGSEWPWPSLTKLTYGRHPGIIGIGAGVGIGKTEFFHELIHYITHTEGLPVGVFLLEEAPKRTVRILAGKSLGLPLHRPDVVAPEQDVQRAIVSLHESGEKLYLFDHKGSRDWGTIFGQAKYLAAVHGVKDIVIDPLTAIISHEENTDRALHKLMADMAVLAADPFNCTVYYSSHLNEPARDKVSHEAGGKVYESQFAGSRAMIRFSNYIIGLERNKQDPDVVKRNTTLVKILKDRDFGSSTGETFEIYYDQTTGRYLEEDKEF